MSQFGLTQEVGFGVVGVEFVDWGLGVGVFSAEDLIGRGWRRVADRRGEIVGKEKEDMASEDGIVTAGILVLFLNSP